MKNGASPTGRACSTPPSAWPRAGSRSLRGSPPWWRATRTAWAGSKSTAAYFLPGGAPIEEGATLTNPDYAAVLKGLAAEGPNAFYTGDVAQGIVDTVQAVEGNAGVMEMIDLALYDVVERPAVCAPFGGARSAAWGRPPPGR